MKTSPLGQDEKVELRLFSALKTRETIRGLL